MNLPLLQPPIKRWYCPNCGIEHMTRQAEPHTPFHNCGALSGIIAPFVEYGTRAKVETHEREDYIGSEQVRVDEQDRPVMSVVTTREDGQDCTVFAPTATAEVKGF